MALKTSPEFYLHVWDTDAIPRVDSTPFAFSDVMYAQILADAGESNPARHQGNTSAGNSQSSSANAQIDETKTWTRQLWLPKPGKNLRVISFKEGVADEGANNAQKAGFSGLALIPQEILLHSYISGNRPPLGKDDTHRLVAWRGVRGSKWAARRRDNSASVYGIYHSESTPDHDVIVETVEKLPAGQQFKMHFESLQVSSSKQKARIRIEFGDNLSIVFRQDTFPALERRAANGTGWENWRNLTGVGNMKLTEPIDLSIEHIAGRLYLTIDKNSFDVLDKSINKSTNKVEIHEVKWKDFKLRVTLYNIVARFELSLLDYNHINDLLKELVPNGGSPSSYLNNTQVLDKVGLKRTLKRNGYGSLDGQSYIFATGWRKNDSAIAVKFDAVDTETAGTQEIDYSALLQPSPDGNETPFLTGVHGYIRGTYQTTDTGPNPDLSAALTDAYISHSEDSAYPGTGEANKNGAGEASKNGAEIHVKVSRSILDSRMPNWYDLLYESAYNPIALTVRHRCSDGTYTPWVTRLKGYIWQIIKSSTTFGDDSMELVLRDPIIRLTNPAGLIEPTVYPLMAFLYVEKQGTPVYSGEIVQEILEIALGPEEADSLNGNGLPNYFLPIENATPVISKDDDTAGLYINGQVPAESVPVLPPYYKYAIDWIKELGAADSLLGNNAVFFYGYVTDNGVNTTSEGIDAWPKPIYGDLTEILETRMRWIIPDAIYEQGDEDIVLGNIKTQSNPANDYNVWIVSNNLKKQNEVKAGSIFLGHAQLPSDHPRAPEKSWTRTRVTQLLTPHAGQPLVQELANRQAEDSPYDAVHQIEFTFRGDELMQWGDLLYIKGISEQVGS